MLFAYGQYAAVAQKHLTRIDPVYMLQINDAAPFHKHEYVSVQLFQHLTDCLPLLLFLRFQYKTYILILLVNTDDIMVRYFFISGMGSYRIELLLIPLQLL